MQGWIKLHRSISENDLWMSEPFTYGQAWVDLLLNASHKDSSFFIRGIEISLKRGDLGWSEVTLSKRWKWSRGKVRRYLGMLKTRGMIVQQANQYTSVITICNYDSYQSEGADDEHQTVQQTEHQAVQRTDSKRYTYKNVKNVKNEKEVNTMSPAKALDYTCWPQLPSDQTMQDWLAMRKRLKANVSQTVINRYSKEFEKAVSIGYTVDFCLQECVTRNWRGFECQWLINSGVGNAESKSGFGQGDTRDRAARAADAAFGSSDEGILEGSFTRVDADGITQQR